MPRNGIRPIRGARRTEPRDIAAPARVTAHWALRGAWVWGFVPRALPMGCRVTGLRPGRRRESGERDVPIVPLGSTAGQASSGTLREWSQSDTQHSSCLTCRAGPWRHQTSSAEALPPAISAGDGNSPAGGRAAAVMIVCSGGSSSTSSAINASIFAMIRS